MKSKLLGLFMLFSLLAPSISLTMDEEDLDESPDFLSEELEGQYPTYYQEGEEEYDMPNGSEMIEMEEMDED
jgi:hypothetical protein